MQRHWQGALIVRDEMDKRFKEISSVAMLARRDVDRHIWLSECRPDLAPSAPAPPGMVATTTLRKKKQQMKKKSLDGAVGSINRTNNSCRGIDDLARSSGNELSDLLRFFSTLDMDLQKLLLEAISKHKSTKTTKKKDSSNQKEGRKFNEEETTLPRQLRRNSSCSVVQEDESPCSFREWTHFSSKQQTCFFEKAKFSTAGLASSRAEPPSNSSCRLTNSSARPRGGCGNVDAEDCACRDVAIQTRRTLRKASKLNHRAREQIWEDAKSFATGGRLLADHSAQTSSRVEIPREVYSEKAIEKQREETTKNVLERWAEPLEQYLSTLQQFEQQLREKWLNPEEIETMSNSGAQTGDLESLCTLHTSDTLETQVQRASLDEVKTKPDKPLSNRELLNDGDGVHPLLHNLKQECFAIHESPPQTLEVPEVRDPDENFHRTRAATNSLASGSLHSKAIPEYLAAGFRARKLVEWWPTEKPPRLHTAQPRSERSIFSVYDPKTLLGKQIAAEKPSVKVRKEKPEWWPALRRPYSASEIEAMRQIEDTVKATKQPSPSKIFSGYRTRRPSGNKSPKRKTQDIETSGNQCASQCTVQQDDDSRNRALPTQVPPLRSSPRKGRQKARELCETKEEPQKVHQTCRDLGILDESGQSNVNYLSKCSAGYGGLHALQEHGMPRFSNTVEDQVCGIITQLEDQVCEITTQFQQIETPRAPLTQAGDQSQTNLKKEIRIPPAVDVQDEHHEVNKKWSKRHQSNLSVQQGVERLADKLIDQAVNEVASELAEFCENVADQMYSAEFVA